MQWTQLIRFESTTGKVLNGEPILKAGQTISRQNVQGLKARVIQGDIFSHCEVTEEVAEVKKLLAPIVPRSFRGIGLNYRQHAEETNSKIPKNPIVFLKPPQAGQNPFDPIIVPSICQDDQTDYEVELAIVIGKPCRNVTKEDALNYVAGYTICNDVSARKWQQFADLSSGQWCFGKSFDTFAPLGPAIVSSKVIQDPNNLVLGAKLNGKQVQHSNTADMIFNCKHLISFLSQGSTLLPGDVIITGTPQGVGASRQPPMFLKDNDRIECYIEKIGSIDNPVIYEAHAKL
ncbi:hypothetical protein BZG36_01663 [Bifiguratus adelaidae]|uniref:Fumarylacetoacetase-like C-terminal domain-containing protein n=1 Tax=Bifiguratus adelaidae TaxID=1938954 RepID=A0A261Y4D1_9FUNG|nr:hypothetical protein BZG36_01663 [Bifiguratus adelaidae]